MSMLFDFYFQSPHFIHLFPETHSLCPHVFKHTTVPHRSKLLISFSLHVFFIQSHFSSLCYPFFFLFYSDFNLSLQALPPIFLIWKGIFTVAFHLLLTDVIAKSTNIVIHYLQYLHLVPSKATQLLPKKASLSSTCSFPCIGVLIHHRWKHVYCFLWVILPIPCH